MALRNAPLRTRLRAWLLRTFRGRSPRDAAWSEESPVSARPPQSFVLGALRIDVNPRGLKAAGNNRPSIVYEVRIFLASDPRAWSSSYGFPPREGSARTAADAALDELAEIALDRDHWWQRVTAGMTEDEAEAMEDNPSIILDQRSAEWVGPELKPWRDRRSDTGSWLEPDKAPA
ncbi:MAG: hypothetical protein ACR2MY_11700 [Candidatus Dormibacteria bacterium]